MTSETIDLTIKAILAAFNAAVLAFVIVLVSKWHRRMEDKLDDIQRYLRHVSDRNDAVYLNQLESLKAELIKQERYEEAERVSKCIEQEFDDFKRRTGMK